MSRQARVSLPRGKYGAFHGSRHNKLITPQAARARLKAGDTRRLVAIWDNWRASDGARLIQARRGRTGARLTVSRAPARGARRVLRYASITGRRIAPRPTAAARVWRAAALVAAGAGKMAAKPQTRVSDAQALALAEGRASSVRGTGTADRRPMKDFKPQGAATRGRGEERRT
jgi:hypothetical protein